MPNTLYVRRIHSYLLGVASRESSGTWRLRDQAIICVGVSSHLPNTLDRGHELRPTTAIHVLQPILVFLQDLSYNCYACSPHDIRVQYSFNCMTDRARHFTKLSPLHEHEARGPLTSVIWSRRQWLADEMDNSHVNWIVGIISGSPSTR